MYKLLLSWRYLRSRYIALASIISVTLGVGTLIVVNSVMAGFSHEMHVRLHGILSDIIFEAVSHDGFVDPDLHVAKIKQIVGDDLVGITKAVHVPSMAFIDVRGQLITRQVTMIGVDEESYADVSDFRGYLLHPENRERLSFQLREGGYGDGNHPMPEAGWQYRRTWAQYEKDYHEQQRLLEESRELERQKAQAASDPAAAPRITDIPLGPPDEANPETELFDKRKEQYTGVIVGIGIGCIKQRDPQGKVQDYYLCRPGDDIKITFASAGTQPKALSESFTVVDFYESKMSDYDTGFVFVPLKELQKSRGMGNAVTTIQLKVKPGTDLGALRDKLRAEFPAEKFPYRIQTWRDMQGPLLAAVQLETTLLNILLFLIIAVAGFGILATFFMIVVEKTKDIGVLKALGASSQGVMSIFLGYGLSLGLVGSGVGMIGGLLFVANINRIAGVIEWLTGQEVFDPTIYYFSTIPTIISPMTVAGVMFGAVLIAVLASVLPALRAARLHPVEALRYE